jgi:maleate cis-trans isomerase
MSAHPPQIGILYPLHSAEDDYPRFCSALDAPVNVHIVHTNGHDSHSYDALLELGSPAHLDRGIAELRGLTLDVCMWACTSGSFVFGPEGAQAQVRRIESRLGVPTSSTSLAFIAACKALDITRVSIAATYPEDITRRFRDFLGAFGVQVYSSGNLDKASGHLASLVESEQVIEFARACDHVQAQAVLIPDTALHTVQILNRLEERVGKTVLTANQVTMWHALRLGGSIASGPNLGRLLTIQSLERQ